MTKALITGSAGFIGFHLCRRLLAQGWDVVGVDAMTETYDPVLKADRLGQLDGDDRYRHARDRIETPGRLTDLMAQERPEIVVHLAAHAGVRASIVSPRNYLEANVAGTFEVLEAVRAHPPRHTLMASTSSVYGASRTVPYVETANAAWQISPYAATKRAAEALAHAHAHIYDLPITVFRFFTVYGPWGRPDMAYYLFADAISNGRPVDLFNEGRMRRDFVYVDDLIEAITRLFAKVPGTAPPVERDSLSPVAPFRLVNIGKSAPDSLTDFIAEIEKALGRAAEKRLLPMQAGDMVETWADASLLETLTGYKPSTPLSAGIPRFVDWFQSYTADRAARAPSSAE